MDHEIGKDLKRKVYFGGKKLMIEPFVSSKFKE
jgi:hypothetical protein